MPKSCFFNVQSSKSTKIMLLFMLYFDNIPPLLCTRGNINQTVWFIQFKNVFYLVLKMNSQHKPIGDLIKCWLTCYHTCIIDHI